MSRRARRIGTLSGSTTILVRMKLRLTFTPLVLALAAPLGAQDVHVVDGTGAGDFLTIQEAVDAASNDDTLLIKAGDYAGFTVEGKALQVVAESGQQVRVTDTVYIANQEDRDDVYLSGLTANYRLGQLGNPVGGLHGGLILLEHGQSLDPAGLGFGYGVRVHGLTRGFTAVSSTLEGAHSDNGHGLHAILCGWSNIVDISVYHSVLRGGNGGDGFGWGCFDGGDGGSGAWMGSGRLFTQRLAIFPGFGGPGCPAGSPGQDVILDQTGQHIPLAHPRTRLQVPDLLREGDPMPIELHAPAFQQAWLLEAGAFNSQELSTAVGLLHLGGPITIHPLGAIPASGALTLNWTTPVLPPGAESTTRYFQLLVREPTGRFLSNPSGLVVLDPAF